MRFKVTPMNPETFDLQLEELLAAKKQMDFATEHYRAVQELFIKEMDGRKTRTGLTRDGKIRATLVQGTRTIVNEAGLKKALGARLFNKLTTAKLDQAKLKAALSLGELDAQVVAQYSEVVANAPYVKMSPVSDGDDD